MKRKTTAGVGPANTGNRKRGERRSIDMLHGPLAGKILLFALPLAITGILQQLFNTADVAIVGHYVGSDAMAAVGSNAPVIGLLVNLFVGISLGANVVISQMTGQGNRSGISRAVHTAILVALLSGCGIAPLGQAVAGPMLRLMGVPESVFPLSLSYLRIYLAGMPIIFLYNYEAAIYRSQGDTRTPLICLMLAGVINVGLNLFFVRVLGMSANGVALATVISNGASALWLLIGLLRTDGPTRLSFSSLRIDRAILRRMLRIGVPTGMQGMVFSISNILIQSAINSLGAEIMAASSAAFNMEIFVYYVLNAFGQACTTFTGQNVGAGQRERCRSVLRWSLLLSFILTAGLGIALGIFRYPIMQIFSDNETVLYYGAVRILIVATLQPINMLIETFSGSLRGYGHATLPALVTVFGICGTRILWILTVFRLYPTFNALMIVYPVSWTVTASVLLFHFMRIRKEMFSPLPAGS